VNPHVAAAIAAIGQDAWQPIRYPRAVWDDQLDCWVSDAEVAEIRYAAFTRKKGQEITARLIVRRTQIRQLWRLQVPERPSSIRLLPRACLPEAVWT
jgi:hypothetical protein